MRCLITKKCQNCGREYEVEKWREHRTKYCSLNCHQSIAGRAGGKKGKGVSRNKGAKHSYLGEYNKKHPQRNENNPAWKGEKVGYHALHLWISRHYGYPDTCERCGTHESNHAKIHWANISGDYLRIRSDWLRLCASCHVNFDRGRRKKVEKLAFNS